MREKSIANLQNIIGKKYINYLVREPVYYMCVVYIYNGIRIRNNDFDIYQHPL